MRPLSNGQLSAFAIAVAGGAIALSCDTATDSTSPTHPAAGKSGAGTGGSSGEGALGGSTGTGGSAAATSGTAGSMSVGGTAGTGEAGAGAGGQSGSAGSGGTAATGGTGGSNGGAGEGGAGGTGPIKCDPSSPEPDCVLTGLAGIFVATHASGGDDGNNGTQSAPFATITHAIDLAVSRGVPVYVCAGTYKEHVEITDDDVSLHGGFTCTNSVWTYAPSNRSRIAPTTKNEALRIKGVIGLDVTDMDLVAADATAPGASSVGVFVSGSKDVAFTRVHVSAGNGADGENGVLAPYVYADADSLKGNDASGDSGATANDSCPCESTSIHTKGASGGDAGQNGGTGEPALGGGTAGDFGAPCSNGGLGANAPGVDHAGGATAHGTVESTGWVPEPGGAGSDGTPGQGGGGGGGGLMTGNGGGGGGACGGCGGKGGAPGNGGGASIAVLVVGSNVMLQSCKLDTSSGANGGEGTGGQPGQSGGIGGNRVGAACLGGNGGAGATGGAGGGGAGGISVGIVYDATTSVITADSATVITPGTFGAGGLGGGTGNNGVSGVAAEQLPI